MPEVLFGLDVVSESLCHSGVCLHADGRRRAVREPLTLKYKRHRGAVISSCCLMFLCVVLVVV